MKIPSSGLALASLDDSSTFEAQLYLALKGIDKETKLAKKFGDEGDRVRVHRRQIISAILDALFYSNILSNNDGALDLNKDDVIATLLIDFAAARRDFMHDCQRLDNGVGAELILAPSGKESTISQPIIKADRKILIQALVAIELGTGHKDVGKQKISDRIRLMADTAGYSVGSMAQYRKEMNKSLAQSGKKTTGPKSEFSDAECQLFRELHRRITNCALGPGQGMDLLMPGVRGLRKSRIAKPESVTTKKKNKN